MQKEVLLPWPAKAFVEAYTQSVEVHTCCRVTENFFVCVNVCANRNNSVDFDDKYSTERTPTYLSDSVSVSKNSVRYD